jgi:uncharacterized protein (TIGR03437 family)
LFLLAVSSSGQITVTTVAGGGSEDGIPASQGHQIPGHFAFGPDGTIYFASSYRIWSITPDGILHILAGTGISGFNSDGPELSTNLSPGSVVLDSAGNLYFTDSSRIRKLAGGVVTTIAGNGLPASPATDGEATEIPVDYLTSLALDSNNNLYIAEATPDRVRRLTPDGKISLFAGAPQPFANPPEDPTPDDGDGGPATLAHLSEPLSIAVDSKNNVYIAEAFLIRKVTPDGNISTILGSANNTAPPISAGADPTAVAIRYLTTMAIDPAGSIWFVVNGVNSGTYKIGADGKIALISTNAPAMLLFDQTGAMYTRPAGTSTLTKLPPGGGASQVIAGPGSYSTADGAQAIGAVITPSAITVDSEGRLVFADSHCRIRRINPDGTLATIAGTGVCATTPASGPAFSTNLWAITRLFQSGDVLFFYGGQYIGWLDSNANIGVSQKYTLSALAGDGLGGAYIAQDHTILKFGTASGASPFFDFTTVNLYARTTALETDSQGNLRAVLSLEQNGTYGWTFSSDGKTIGKFAPPLGTTGMCFNGATSYFAMPGEFQVETTGSFVTGLGAFSGDGGPMESAGFNGISDVACDAEGNVYVLDHGNARIRKFSGSLPKAAPAISANGVVNSASYTSGGISAGELVSIFGQNLAPSTQIANVTDGFPTVIGNVQVMFGSSPIPLLAVSPGQINALIPTVAQSCTTGQTTVTVVVDTVASAAAQVPCAVAAPGIFTADQSGKGQGAILNQDGTVNSASNPAPRGSIVSIYGTGGGAHITYLWEGYLNLSPPYGDLSIPVTVTIAGESTPAIYAGGAPDLVDGAVQINAAVPSDIAPGVASVVVNIGGIASNTVQMWTK